MRDCGTCRSGVLNGKKLYLLDKREDLRRFGLWALRLSFTTENPGEIDTVLSNLYAPFDPGACTRGLYYRGVERVVITRKMLGSGKPLPALHKR